MSEYTAAAELLAISYEIAAETARPYAAPLARIAVTLGIKPLDPDDVTPRQAPTAGAIRQALEVALALGLAEGRR